MNTSCKSELTTIEVNQHLESFQFSLDGDVSVCEKETTLRCCVQSEKSFSPYH